MASPPLPKACKTASASPRVTRSELASTGARVKSDIIATTLVITIARTIKCDTLVSVLISILVIIQFSFFLYQLTYIQYCLLVNNNIKRLSTSTILWDYFDEF